MGRQLQFRKRNSGERALGIRATPRRAETLESDDATVHGVYWFDLSTRAPVGAKTKRVIDVLGSLALIVLLAPLFLMIMAAIRLTSRGKVIFVQRRIGFRCNEFDMYKFRTMVVGAHEVEARLADESESGFLKLKDDPRITRVGRFLRKYSLDELPQLFNVLEGSMSLVGPRPLLLSDLQRFPLRGQMRRFSVRPGVTGLWQVSGRSETSEDDRMKLDREYVNEWSLWLDVKILLRTVLVVFSGRGAA